MCLDPRVPRQQRQGIRLDRRQPIRATARLTVLVVGGGQAIPVGVTLLQAPQPTLQRSDCVWRDLEAGMSAQSTLGKEEISQRTRGVQCIESDV